MTSPSFDGVENGPSRSERSTFAPRDVFNLWLARRHKDLYDLDVASVAIYNQIWGNGKGQQSGFRFQQLLAQQLAIEKQFENLRKEIVRRSAGFMSKDEISVWMGPFVLKEREMIELGSNDKTTKTTSRVSSHAKSKARSRNSSHNML
jgi:hypothetical protein